MTSENLLVLKEDMVAFIEGHGMRRLPGYVTEDLPAILWEDAERQETWKDFVEMAKHCGAPFITFSEIALDPEEIDHLIEDAEELNFPDEESGELAEARWLKQYTGKIGYIQLGFVHQGVMVLHETTTEWYERYQGLIDDLEGFSDVLFDNEFGENNELGEQE